MYPKFLCLVLLLGLSSIVLGQRCGFTDTIPIGQQGLSDVMIDIENYLNNDLSDAGQGLCGVSVYFQHSYVYDFSITVISPAGQSVELVGPINAQTRPATSLARWFIDFNACAEVPVPDPGASGQWNNNSLYNWPAFGLYRGSYAPATGCFEDLNTGPVNGDWTFSFNTTRANEQGRVTYLLLEFCDDRNAQGPCCFADAGTLQPIPDLEFCEQTPDVPLGLTPRYRRPRPDPSLYGYTYAIARNDSVLATQEQVNLGNLRAGTYEICGLSYRLGELSQFAVDGSRTFNALRQDFASANPSMCASLTPVCQFVDLYPIPDTTFVEAQICDGGVFRVGNSAYTTTDIHTTTLTGRAGCDSTVVLDLEIVTLLRATLDTTICAEAVYPQDGNLYTIPGTYVDTVLSYLGCDSIITLNLDVAQPIVKDTVTAICGGTSFLIGTEAFTTTGVFTRTIPAVNGCDSVVNLDLVVLDPMIVIAPVPAGLTCDDPLVTLDASGSTFGNPLNRGVWNNAAGEELSFARSITADSAGLYIYELTHIERDVGCTVTDTIDLRDFRLDVMIDLALTQVQCNGLEEQCRFISCRNPTPGIEAAATPTGPAYDYQWSVPPGGNIIGAGNTPGIIVDAPGTYRLSVVDPATGCRQDTLYTIGLDTLIPSVSFTGNELLNCAVDSITLVADTLQANADSLAFVWTGSCLPGPVVGSSITLGCPGRVTLSVSNRFSGCLRDTTFAVAQDLSPSNIDLAPAAAPLSCYFPERMLDASGSNSVNGQAYYWVHESGPDTVGFSSVYPATVAGTYTLTAVDVRSLCSASATVMIPADTLPPMADSGADTLALNCFNPEFTLGGPGTSTGPEFRYSWVQVGEPLDTLGRERTLFVEDPGGFFRLAVTNVDNGCITTDQTRVLLELDTPVVRIALPLDFDCFVDSVALDARMTNLDFDKVTIWTGPCLAPTLDTNLTYAYCPGTYHYSVINQQTGCRSRDSVTIELADNSVVAVLPDSAFIDCNSGETRLDRSAGTDAPVVRWFRDGAPIDLIGQQPLVTVPGEYTLVLGNFNESCLDTARTLVVANCPALAVVVPPDSLTCTTGLVLLDGRAAVPSAGPNVTTEWLIPPGATTRSEANERLLTVFSPGNYGFVLRNLISGDIDTSFVEVIRNVTPPVADAGERGRIDCYEPTLTLSGAGSSEGPVYDYLWTNTGDDTLGLLREVDVSRGGVYLLRVTQRVTGCSSVDNVRVISDLDVPDLNFTSAVLPCDTVDFRLAVIPDESGIYTYNWRGAGILAQADNDTVRISSVGTYAVEVTNVDNGCRVTDSIVATRLPCPPFPILADTSLTCKSDAVELITGFREPCRGCSFSWRRNGVAIAGETDISLTVSETGVYRIVAINQFGLRGFAEATVTDARFVPTGDAGPDEVLTCSVTEVLLGGVADDNRFPYTYQWLGPDGNPVAGARSDTLRVGSGGLYQLETTNTFSGCSLLDTVRVTYDTVHPVSNAGDSRLLDCNNKRRVLDGINSTLGRRYVYRWSGGPSIACMEGSNTLNPLVRCGGEYTLVVTDTINGCTDASRVNVGTDEALPVVIPYPDTSVNCARDTLLLEGRDITRPNIDFGWEEVLPGGNRPLSDLVPGVLEVTGAGTFRFFIRDRDNGCFNDFSVNVTADLTLPTVSASAADTFFCALDSLLVSGAGSIVSDLEPVFSWSSQTGFFVNEADSAVASVFQPDTYYLTVTDPRNSCVGRDSVVIFRDIQAPIADAGADVTLTCDRRQVQLNGSGLTISGQATYAWTNRNGVDISAANTTMPTVDSTGRFLFTVTDPANDCSGADIVEVMEDTIPPMARILAQEGLAISCLRPEVSLSGRTLNTPVGMAGFRWQGPPGSGPEDPNLRNITAASSGNYRLIVNNTRNGCQDTAFIAITEDFVLPVSVLEPPEELTCIRDSVVLRRENPNNDPAFRFEWRDEGDNVIADTEELRVFDPGTYRLITTDGGNGCRDTTSTVVNADLVLPEVVLLEPLVLNCFRSETFIDGTGSSQGNEFILDWTSPSNSHTGGDDPYRVRGTEPGFYFLDVVNRENGCRTVDSVELIVEAVSIDGLTVEVDQPACEEDRDGSAVVTAVEGGTPPFRYRLNGGLITDRVSYEGLPIGNYRLEAIGADGCAETESFSVLEGTTPVVDLRPDTLIRLGDSVRLDFTTNFPNWDTLIWTSGGPLPALQSDSAITVRPLSSRSYRLVIRDDEGCSATDVMVVDVNGQVEAYVPTAFSPNNDGNNDLLRPFAGTQVQRWLTFKVYDRWGELVYDMAQDAAQSTEDFGWDGRLDGRPLSPQVFVWELEFELLDGAVIKRFGQTIMLR